LHPEHYGSKWTTDRNRAFWVGAIESGHEFLIATPFAKIMERPFKRKKDKNKKKRLGYVISEILWLLDHGYTLVRDKNNPELVRAIPSENEITVLELVDYGKFNIAKSLQQVERIVVKDVTEDNKDNVKCGLPSQHGLWGSKNVEQPVVTQRPLNPQFFAELQPVVPVQEAVAEDVIQQPVDDYWGWKRMACNLL
jgi:hypothetical protein